MNDLILVDETKSHEMVRYWMIHVNQIMCMEIKKLYRSNPVPQPISSQFELIKKYQESHNQLILSDSRENIVSFLKINNNDKLCQFMVKCLLVKASYTTEDLSHYGIGISNYTHWTSPIRRASDLINHCLFKGYDINVTSYLENINNCETTQDKIEAFILNYNNYKNLKCEDEQIYLAIILDIFPNSISVFINKLNSKYTIHISKLSKDKLIFDSMEKILKNENENDNIEYKLFQEILLVIDKVNFDSIEFSIKLN
jgi:exoribonuclease R